MNTTAYKGFNIYELNSRFVAQDKGDAKFKSDGYSTLNNAKGAITKHLIAKVDAVVEALAVAEVKPEPIVLHWGNHSVSLFDAVPSVKQSRNKREGRFVGNTNKRPVRLPHVTTPNFLMSFRVQPTNRKQRKAVQLQNKAGA